MENNSEFKNNELDQLLDQQLNQIQWEEPSDDQLKKMEQYWFSLSDQELDVAQWEEPTEEQIVRLNNFWLSLPENDKAIITSPVRRKFSLAHPVYRIAAVALILVTGVFLFWSNYQSKQLETVQKHPVEKNFEDSRVTSQKGLKYDKPSTVQSKKQIVDLDKDSIFQPDIEKADSIPNEPTKPEPQETETASFRAPNAYETLIIQHQLDNKDKQTYQERVENVNQILQQLAVVSRSQASEIAKPLLSRQYQYESILLENLPRMEATWQLASIRLLSVIGRERSFPYLLQFMKNSALRSESLQALSVIAPAERLSQLIPNLRNDQEKKLVLRELLSRNSPASLKYYFQQVKNKEVRKVALTVLPDVKNLNYEWFFQLLNSPLYEDQINAAFVLGRSDNTEVITRLLNIVSQQNHSRSAIVAILVSDHEKAIQFLETAIRYPVLSSEIHSARTQLSVQVN